MLITRAVSPSTFKSKWIFLAALLVAGQSEVNAQQDTANSTPIVIERNQDLPEDLIVFARSVIVRGVARQGVAAFGGSVIVEGTVKGDVAVVGGSLEIKDGGIVHGDVIVIGGKLQRGELGRIDGRVFSTSLYEEKLFNVFTEPSKELLTVDLSAAAIGWRILRTITWFIISVLVFKIFPVQVTNAARRLKVDLLRVSVVGVISTLAFLTALFVFLVLCIIFIGVPLIIVWVLFCGTAWVFGCVAFYYFFGQVAAGSLFKDRSPSPAVLLLIGVVLYGFLRAIPVITFFMPYLALILSMGIVVTTRFGTGTPWFRKKAEPI